MNSLPKKVSVVYWNKWIIAEIGAMVCEVLGHLGYSVLPVDPNKPADPDADVLLLLGDCLHFESFLKNYSRSAKTQRVVLWQVDPLPPPGIFGEIEKNGLRFVKYYLFAMNRSRRLRSVLKKGLSFLAGNVCNYGAVDTEDYYQAVRRYFWLKANIPAGLIDDIYVSTIPKQKSLESMGISSRFVPFGNHPFFGSRVLGIERDIDVLFFGAAKLRRKIKLARLKRELKKKGIKYVFTKGVFGKDRELLLNRSKLSLNLVNQPWDFPGMRFQFYMSCGSAVISERLADTDPYVPGMHYASSDINNLADTIELYSKDDNKRNGLVRAADELISRHTLESSLLKISERF